MVKRRTLFRIYSVLLLFFLSALQAATPGVEYSHLLLDGPVSIHILEIDPLLTNIEAAIAEDSLPAFEKPSSMAKRHGAIAAVNGGFFHMTGIWAGLPSNVLKIGEKWIALPRKERGAIGWKDGGRSVLIDRLASRAFFLQPLIDSATTPFWQEWDYIVNGTPVLIFRGEIVPDFTIEKVLTSFLEKRHPRTAVGIKSDGHWIFVMVEGRNPEISLGMNMQELASFMHSLGCVYALNLDGGGSSALYYDGQVRNYCSGEDDDSPDAKKGEERPVTDAILIFSRENE